MSREMLERFIARGKSEGVPLKSRIPVDILGPSPISVAALCLVMVVMSATLYFGHSNKFSRQIAESKTINSVDPVNRRPSQETTAKIASSEKRITLPSSRRKVTGSVRRVESVASLPDKDELRLRAYSVHLVSNRFDSATDSRNFVLLRRSVLLNAKLDQNAYAAPARLQMANPPLAIPAESAKADLPKLLAAFEYKTSFARAPQDIPVFRPVDAQVLRRDFDPEAYRMLLNLDLKRNLTVFRFTPSLNQ